MHGNSTTCYSTTKGVLENPKRKFEDPKKQVTPKI